MSTCFDMINNKSVIPNGGKQDAFSQKSEKANKTIKLHILKT